MKQMKELETRKEDLEKALAEAAEPPPLLPTTIALNADWVIGAWNLHGLGLRFDVF